MKDVLAKLILILIPILLSIAVVHYAFNGFEGDLLPTYSRLMAMLSEFPDIAKMFQDASANVSAGGLTSVLGVFQMIGTVLSSPFLVIGWFFTTAFVW